jgi:hypothetical protein
MADDSDSTVTFDEVPVDGLTPARLKAPVDWRAT